MGGAPTEVMVPMNPDTAPAKMRFCGRGRTCQPRRLRPTAPRINSAKTIDIARTGRSANSMPPATDAGIRPASE